MGLRSAIKRVVSKITGRSSTTSSSLSPTTSSVKVTDFNTGESVTTTSTTSPSGSTTTTRSGSSSSGGSVTPEREQELIRASLSSPLDNAIRQDQAATRRNQAALSNAAKVEASRSVEGRTSYNPRLVSVNSTGGGKFTRRYADGSTERVYKISGQKSKVLERTQELSPTSFSALSTQENFFYNPPKTGEKGGLILTAKEGQRLGFTTPTSDDSYGESDELKSVRTLLEQGSEGVGGSKDRIGSITKVDVKRQGKLSRVNEELARVTTKPLFEFAETKGFNVDTISEAGLGLKQVQSPLQLATRGFTKGFVKNQLVSLRDEPFSNIALLSLSAGAGAGLRALGYGLKAVGGLKAVQVGEATLAAGGLGLGTLATAKFVTDLSKAATFEEGGEVTGKEFRIAALTAFGLRGGQRIFERGVDIFRTRGRTNLLTKDIVAPEFLEGQPYPAIRRGQTLGEFRKEFFEPSLPTEKVRRGRGFSATSEPFAKEVTVQKGSSEVEGIYSAPKVSPAFLRVSGESRRDFLSPEGLLYGGEPTALRINFNALKKVGSYSQRSLNPLGKARSVLAKAKPGETYIPFVKTEKEAVTVPDTEIEMFGKNYYFEFEGRRVPINEYKIKGSKGKSRDSPKEFDAQTSEKKLFDVVKESSSGKLRRGSSSSLPLASSSLKSYLKSSSSSLSKAYSSASLTSSSSSVSSSGSGRSGRSSSRSRAGSSSGLTSKGSSSIGRYASQPLVPSRKSSRRVSGKGKAKQKRKTKGGLREQLFYTPDFTAKSLNIQKRFSPKELRISAEKGGLGIKAIPIR